MIDDSRDDADLARMAFEQAGLEQQFLVMTDPVEAVQVLGQDSDLRSALRLILLDFNMPRMNGLDVLRALRADSHFANLPVVIMSTSDEPLERVASDALKVSAHFQKPAVFTDFVRLAGDIRSRYLAVA
ncbi:response regulator [Aquilutibacter rugosus]